MKSINYPAPKPILSRTPDAVVECRRAQLDRLQQHPQGLHRRSLAEQRLLRRLGIAVRDGGVDAIARARAAILAFRMEADQ